VPIPAAADPSVGQNLRAQAASLKLTGYYRPEDLEVDPAQLGSGRVRVCGNNTGNEDEDHNWGEAICITDGTLDRGDRQHLGAGGPAAGRRNA
jgi:hypothetical protein